MAQPYTIGLFGPRGCGKTTLLAAIYGYGKKQAWPLQIHTTNAPTNEYLEPRWQMWQTQQMLPPTPLQIIDLQFEIATEQWQNHLTIKDFGGAMVMREKSAANNNEIRQRLRTQIYQFLESCQAVLLLVEYGGQDEAESFARRLEVELLLETLKISFTGTAKPFGLVVTKWDKSWPNNVNKSHLMQSAKEEKSANEYVRSHHGTILNLLQAASQHVSVFPVTALTHQGLDKPLLWAMDKIELTALRECEETQRLQPKAYIAASKQYRQFIASTARPDLRSLAERQLTIIRSKVQRIRKVKATAMAIAFVVCFGLGRYAYELYHFTRFSQQTASIPARQGFTAVVEYGKHKPWLVSWRKEYNEKAAQIYPETLRLPQYFHEEQDIPWRHEVYQAFQHLFPAYASQTDWQTLYQQEQVLYLAFVEKQDWQNLCTFVENHRSDAEAETRYQRCAQFRQKYPNHPQQKLIAEWQAEALVGKQRHEYTVLCQQVQQLSLPEKISTCRTFLKKYKGHQGARKLLAELRQQQDDELYQEIERTAATNQQERAIVQCEAYFYNLLYQQHRHEVRKIYSRLTESWDRQLYEPIIAHRGHYDLQHFAEMNRLIDNYHKQNKLSTMWRRTQHWQEWYKKFLQGQDYQVTIVKAKIGKNCKIVKRVWWPDSDVDLTFNSKTESTSKIVNNWAPEFYKKCEPFRWKPGDPYSFKLAFTVYDWSPETIRWEADTNMPAPYYFFDGISISSGSDNVIVYLECPEARNPNLPDFLSLPAYIEVLSSWLSENPSYWWLYQERGNCYSCFALQHYEQALQSYLDAYRILPENKQEEKKGLTGRIAWTYYKLQRYAEGSNWCKELEPATNGSLNIVASIYAQMGREDEALQYFNRAVQENKASREALHNIATLVFKYQQAGESVGKSWEKKLSPASKQLVSRYIEENLDE